MQNERVLISSLMLGFRAHTRVFATLSVAVVIAFLCLTASTLSAAPVPAALKNQKAMNCTLHLEPERSDLPQIVIRFFFLLPHLVPNKR